MSKILRKITVSDVVGKPTVKTFRNLTTETPVVRMVGIARVVANIVTPHGESLKFTGDFQAVNLLTGELNRSATIYLPAPIDEMLAQQIQDHAGDVEFAFDILVEPSETSTVGYVYKVKTLLEAKESKPMDALLGRIEAPVIAAIPAPKTKA